MHKKKGGDIVALYYKLLPKPIIIHLKSCLENGTFPIFLCHSAFF